MEKKNQLSFTSWLNCHLKGSNTSLLIMARRQQITDGGNHMLQKCSRGHAFSDEQLVASPPRPLDCCNVFAWLAPSIVLEAKL